MGSRYRIRRTCRERINLQKRLPCRFQSNAFSSFAQLEGKMRQEVRQLERRSDSCRSLLQAPLVRNYCRDGNPLLSSSLDAYVAIGIDCGGYIFATSNYLLLLTLMFEILRIDAMFLLRRQKRIYGYQRAKSYFLLRFVTNFCAKWFAP